MVGEELTKLQSKVHSAQAQITTVQSRQSKQKNQRSICQQSDGLMKQSMENNVQNGDEIFQWDEQKVNDSSQNRLFTFMDERDKQKRLIQNFIFKQSSRHHCRNYQPQENNMHILNIPNLQKLNNEEQQRKKRQAFLNKLFHMNTAKSIKSTTKSVKINQNKTPKALLQQHFKYETIDSNNRSKTPKISQNRSVTPKYKKQPTLFRAKSSLQQGYINKMQIKRHVQIKKQEYELQGDESCKKSGKLLIKSLLKKKKELEKELFHVNQNINIQRKKSINTSLTNCPKKYSKIPNPKILKHKKQK